MFDQRGELPLLPFENPIGPSTLLRMVSLPNHFVPASRGGVYIKSKLLYHVKIGRSLE